MFLCLCEGHSEFCTPITDLCLSLQMSSGQHGPFCIYLTKTVLYENQTGIKGTRSHNKIHVSGKEI